MENQSFFINTHNRIFTVRLMWDIAQPFVCGTLTEVVKYAIRPNNGIESFYEITGNKIKRVSKKDLKAMLSHGENVELGVQLFKKY